MTLFHSKDDLVTLLRGAGGTLAIKLISALLLFTVQIVLARILGVESYGVYAIAHAWLLMMLLIGRQGFDIATVRYVAAYRSQRQWPLLRGFLGFSRKFVFSTSMIVGACVALGAWSLRAHYSVEIVGTLVLAAAVLPVFALVETQESALRGLNLVVRSQPPQAILNPLVIIVCLPITVHWLNAPASAETAMAIYLGATVISLTCVWTMLRRHMPGEVGIATPEYRPREWISASLAMMFLMGFVVLMNQISLIVIGALQDSVAAGLFGAASRIANTMQLPVAALGAAIGPMAAGFNATGDRAALQRATRFGVRLVFGLALGVTIVLAIFGRWILGLFGEEFIAAYPMMMVLVAGQLVLAAMGPAGILLNMTGYQNESARIMFICAVANMVLLAVLVPLLGALGGAVATSVTIAAWSGLMALAVFRRIAIVSAITLWRTGATGRA